jgi:hypothetical protein
MGEMAEVTFFRNKAVRIQPKMRRVRSVLMHEEIIYFAISFDVVSLRMKYRLARSCA